MLRGNQLHPRGAGRSPGHRPRIKVQLAAAALAYGLYVLLLTGMPSVPGAYFDDLALELEPGSYLQKVESEARWAVYLWHKYVAFTTRSQNFHLALVVWSVVSAQIAMLLLPAGRFAAIAVATLAIAANPVVMDLLKWPGTVLPMSLLLLIASSSLQFATTRFPVWTGVLAGGVLVNMVSYQLFSLYVLGIALLVCADAAGVEPRAAGKARLWRIGVVASAAIVSMAVGILLMYAANYMAFGVFGVSIEEWRYDQVPGGSSGIALAVLNLWQCAVHLSRETGHMFGPVLLLLLVLAIRNALRGGWRPMPASVGVPVAICLVAAVPFALPLASGLPLPAERGGLTLWLAAVATGLAVVSGPSTRVSRALALASMAILGVVSMAIGTRSLAEFSRQDASNRDWARGLVQAVEGAAAAAAGSRDPVRLVLAGVPEGLEGDAAGQPVWAYWLVRQALRGSTIEVAVCTTGSQCEALVGSGVAETTSTATAIPEVDHIVMAGSSVLVRIGPLAPESGT